MNIENTLDKLQNDSEVRSFVYQQMVDFQTFVSPETVLTAHPIKAKKTGRYRVALQLHDGENSIKSMGEDKNIFEAIRKAKVQMIKHLVAVQDAIMSSQDRVEQVNDVLANTHLH